MKKIKKIKEIKSKIKIIEKEKDNKGEHKNKSELEDNLAIEEVNQFVSFIRQSQLSSQSLEQSDLNQGSNRVSTRQNRENESNPITQEYVQGQEPLTQEYIAPQTSQTIESRPNQSLTPQERIFESRNPIGNQDSGFRNIQQQDQKSQVNDRKYGPDEDSEFKKKKRSDWRR